MRRKDPFRNSGKSCLHTNNKIISPKKNSIKTLWDLNILNKRTLEKAPITLTNQWISLVLWGPDHLKKIMIRHILFPKLKSYHLAIM